VTAGINLYEVSCIFSGTGKAAREVRAVDNVNLEIKAGEFFTLLGPSGSGKTTCLRMIGGFTLPTSGKIFIGNVDVSQVPPYARPVNTVFQDYALFPHMTIAENVAYGLMVKGIEKSARQQRANEMLELVRLSNVGDRRPAQLSGGQRQRVALARALVNEPEVLLLDEPLGALDLKLREQMQSELKQLQRRLGITFLFITHDQHEALSMSDRIGVFNQGKIEQIGGPSEIYNAPSTKFVAQFIGAANVFEGAHARSLVGANAAMLRPERLVFSAPGIGRVQGVVEEVQYFGSFSRVRVAIEDTFLSVDIPAHSAVSLPNIGDRVGLNWDDHAVHTLAG
jgi:putative spermidine/putrescine transport system ATP-binding protein